MSIESLIQQYGYMALFIGSFLEGESIVVVAGFMAHRGYLLLPWVMFWAFCGSVLSDQLFFLLGYTRGQRFLANRPRWQRKAKRVLDLSDHHQIALCLGFRFVYGIRNVTPFVMGASGFSPLRFVALNLIGAVVWAAVVSAGGYAFGEVLQRILQDVRRYELWVVGGLFACGAMIWCIMKLRARRAGSNLPVEAPSAADVTAAEQRASRTTTPEPSSHRVPLGASSGNGGSGG